jgi:polysaccharide pyruvyl transferase CsaB
VILVSGYYGFDNLGDEAILAALCQDLAALGVSRREIAVPSGNPAKTAALHGVTALGRFDLPGIWRALSSARCLISGGGSLLQDVTSRRSIPYYLSLVELALLLRVPVVMYAQGLGPIGSGFFRAWTARAYRRAAACSVRDGESLAFLAELGVPRERIVLAADPVFAREPAASGGGTGKLLLNLRPYPAWAQEQELWVEILGRWLGEGYRVEFVPLGPGDAELGALLQSRLPGLQLRAQVELQEVDAVFQGAQLCIAMRLHGVIFSALNGCLPLGINYDPKVAAICAQLRVPHVEVGGLRQLPELVDLVLAEYEERRAECLLALGELRRRAEHNRRLLAQVLR